MQSIIDVCSPLLLAPWDDQHGSATSAAMSCEKPGILTMNAFHWLGCVMCAFTALQSAGGCSRTLLQERAGIHVESSGHVTLTMYMPARRPYWSPSLASWSAGTLDIINSTVAVWQWHRNQASMVLLVRRHQTCHV